MDSAAPLTRLWLMRAAYFGLVLVILFFHLLPLDTVPRRIAPPDLFEALTFAWVLRRPDYVPPLSIAAAMLLADLLLQRPPGLTALAVLLGAEFLRARGPGMRDTGFLFEWLVVALVMLAIPVLTRVVMGLSLTVQSPLSLVLSRAGFTILAYPLVVAASQALLGVRRPAPGSGEQVGLRA
ncbi:rod shape-determining protein MreD [Pukyongiella litopenaei]|uniref:Rod shape-determining protein MreD n=1 Tax=Pukyongiella litopenaei TaxID=2605946 RepID=A0A2S0MVJ2_9RHOB|nr:rod shape-determining protein MreD [Pukyongiella litopenaei]AVO39703.1 rod shape-determining protein MreD [Pukyongiella litopenaei]